MDMLQAYVEARHPLPKTMLVWPLRGRGLENLGRDGRPEEWPVPECGDHEILARVDAVGLCFSDIKILSLGGDHPRIYGRDLAQDPVVPGHEVSLTVAKVGEGLRGQFEPGQRFILQADIYYQGKGLAFGYALHGGLEQYCLCGEEILQGDEGCYLIPVDADADYAGTALTEPWACVEAAYRARQRDHLQPGGAAWFLAAGAVADADYRLPPGLDAEEHPARVVVTNLPRRLRGQIQEQCAALGIPLSVADNVQPSDFQNLMEAETGGAGFDDIVILGAAEADVVEAAAGLLARQGLLCLMADEPMSRKVEIDVGRIHYEKWTVVGGTGTDIAAAYRPARGAAPRASVALPRQWGHGSARGSAPLARPAAGSAELVEGGLAWFIGAGGPMGQMHVHRAAQDPRGPGLLVGSDLQRDRLDALAEGCQGIIEDRGARLVLLNPQEMDPDSFSAELARHHGGRGFDDIVLMVPVVSQLEAAYDQLAPAGFLNIFAGIGRGTMAHLDLSRIYREGVRVIGASGSTISDLEWTLARARRGEIIPRRSLAAIGGIQTVREGLEALETRRFPGKVVIFPHIEDLPLIALPELEGILPNVYELLEDGKWWTREAEMELLRSCLKRM